MHAVRSARPKLSLAVPAAAKPSIPSLVIPGRAAVALTSSVRPAASPLTPTTRNTALNARACSSLHVPAMSLATGRAVSSKACKKVSFAEHQSVSLVSPCPPEYYGDYAKTSRDERRWNSRS